MFVEARTRRVLSELCRRLGRSDRDVVLVRHHTNAVYLIGDLVVKIAPPEINAADLERTVTLTRWLCDQGFPTVGLHPGIDQPVRVGGYQATVWERLDPAESNPVTVAELGELLRRLHTLPPPPLPVPALEPIASTRRSIDAANIIGESDRQMLRARLNRLAEAWHSMRFAEGPALVHADPQTRNSLRRGDGTAVLSDWDTASIGAREWDLATIAVHCRRFSAHEGQAFTRFAEAYGWDPRDWESFEDLCQLRELKMIATNARKSRPGTAAATEVHRRVAEVRQAPATPLAWHIL